MATPIRLYRSLMKASASFGDYNVRAYALERTRYGFQQARTETDPVK